MAQQHVIDRSWQPSQITQDSTGNVGYLDGQRLQQSNNNSLSSNHPTQGVSQRIRDTAGRQHSNLKKIQVNYNGGGGGGGSVDHYVPRNSNVKKKGDYKKNYNSKNTNNSVLQTDSMESLDSNIGALNSNNYSNLSGSYGIRAHEGAAPGQLHSNIT